MVDVPSYRMVRGGYCGRAALRAAAETCLAELGRPGLSVYAAPMPRYELLAAARIAHATVRFGWVRCLTKAGFEVEQTFAWPHHTVWLPDISDATLDRFVACFGPPVSASSAGTVERT